MPTPEAAEPSTVAKLGELLGAGLAAVLATKGVQRLRNGKASKVEPDRGLIADIAKAVAKEVVREMLGESRDENDRHREGIERAIDRLGENVDRLTHEVAESVRAVRDANESTRTSVFNMIAALRK